MRRRLRPGHGHRGRSLVAGALLAALLSSLSVTLVTRLWDLPLRVPFQYSHSSRDDQEDATLDMMLIKNIHETGWFNTNPALNAPFQQHWAEWPMGGDLLAYTVKKALVDSTGDVPLTLNLFWLQLVEFAATRTDIGKGHRTLWAQEKLENHASRYVGRHMMESCLALSQSRLRLLALGDLSF